MIDTGEVLTRGSIWITLAGYAAGAAVFALSRKRTSWDSFARLAWTVACASLIAHVTFAFHFYHGWSHDAAYLDTARQTGEVVGLNWGGGLYINYALVTAWLLDVGRWWLGGLVAYRRRAWPLVIAWQGFLIFIIFNAAVVFKTGILRWVGICLCLGLCVTWWLAARTNFISNPVESGARMAEN